MGEYVPDVLRTNKGDIIELLARWIEVVKLIEHNLEKSGVWLAPMEETAVHVKNASTTAGRPRASTNLHNYRERVSVILLGGSCGKTAE